MKTIDEYRRAAESIVRRDTLAELESWLAGGPPPPLPGPPLPDGSDPFTADAVAALRASLPQGDDAPARVHQLLHRGLLAGALARAVRPALAAAAGSAVAHLSYVTGEPGADPARAEAAWWGCEDPAEREALYARLLPAWSGSAPAWLEAARATRAAAARLGLPDPDSMVGTLARVDPVALRTASSRLLEATEGLLGQALQQAAEAHDLPLRPAHLPRLFGLPEMEHRFTAERMLPVAGGLLDGMGLHASHEQGLQVLEDRQPGPRPSRAFPVNLPREVRLVVHRAAGIRMAELHLLALGQAMHWLYTEPGPFPFRWPLGHRAVSDGPGLLLASLLTHPAMLQERGVPDEVAATLGKVARRSRLLHLRTMAALLACGPGGPEAAADPWLAHAAAIGRARGIPVDEPEARAWPQRVDALYAAETLQSWLLAAALRRSLRARLGERWWRDPAAGESWIEWLKPGQRLSVTELIAARTGVPPAQALDPAPLVEWLSGED